MGIGAAASGGPLSAAPAIVTVSPTSAMIPAHRATWLYRAAVAWRLAQMLSSDVPLKKLPGEQKKFHAVSALLAVKYAYPKVPSAPIKTTIPTTRRATRIDCLGEGSLGGFPPLILWRIAKSV